MLHHHRRLECFKKKRTIKLWIKIVLFIQNKRSSYYLHSRKRERSISPTGEGGGEQSSSGWMMRWEDLVTEKRQVPPSHLTYIVEFSLVGSKRERERAVITLLEDSWFNYRERAEHHHTHTLCYYTRTRVYYMFRSSAAGLSLNAFLTKLS